MTFGVSLENRKEEQVLPGLGGLVPVGGGEEMVKGERRWIWCKNCIHMFVNGNIIAVDVILGSGDERKKENGGWGEFK
jgi:hypothetical protein